jgi:hypothetical protein
MWIVAGSGTGVRAAKRQAKKAAMKSGRVSAMMPTRLPRGSSSAARPRPARSARLRSCFQVDVCTSWPRPSWKLAPVPAPDCAPGAVLLAEIRFEPLDTARAGASGLPASAEPVTDLRFERPLGEGVFTPPSAPDGFYAYTPDAMGEALGLRPGALSPDWWLARDTGAAPTFLTQTPPERHMAYAITWFAMALALIAVYLAFHARAGRLTLNRP